MKNTIAALVVAMLAGAADAAPAWNPTLYLGPGPVSAATEQEFGELAAIVAHSPERISEKCAISSRFVERPEGAQLTIGFHDTRWPIKIFITLDAKSLSVSRLAGVAGHKIWYGRSSATSEDGKLHTFELTLVTSPSGVITQGSLVESNRWGSARLWFQN